MRPPREIMEMDLSQQPDNPRRFVFINELEKIAIPCDSERQALMLIRRKLADLNAPSEPGVHNNFNRDFGQNPYQYADYNVSSFDEIDDSQIGEIASDLFVVPEGSRGVWSNFVTSDRVCVGGRWPEDPIHGNADTTYYATFGVRSGTQVPGEDLQMESIMRPPREIMEMDLSRQPGNPTSELQAHAQELWAIQDPQELANAAINIVKPLVGRGMSQKNYQMFLRNMQGAMRRGLTGVQSYITNYILKGSGMGRDQEGGRRPAFGEGVLHILARSDAAVFNEALRSFGLKIVGRINTDPLRTQVRNEDVAALASTITEDAYTPVELSTPAKIAKKIAEEAGYVVAVIEEDDLVE